ncbi:MAG: DUF4080 domain-containing protein [Planctomycetota bacterium]
MTSCGAVREPCQASLEPWHPPCSPIWESHITKADIILATLNARYAHCAFGLRYLFANLGDLQPRARLLEFDINQRPLDIAENILGNNPRILGLGLYVWNASQTLVLVRLLKQLRPDLILVLGGPEISHETDQQEISRFADHIIPGEADLAFAQLCRQLLSSSASPFTPAPPPRPPLPDLAALALPYDFYTDDDLAHRVIYIEASRGCPYECEFCLSALDETVRQFPLDRFLAAMQRLLDRGYRQFKFVDRTFNLDLKTSDAILQFFLDRYQPGLFLHFEMIPDRLPESLRVLIQQFPPASLQFEVGVQTFNEEVARRISRRQNNANAEENLRWLRARTGVHIHADLIVGLPGESLDSFAAGFDRLVALQPHEIQVGILKRLRGAPIAHHTAEWQMIYDPHPPYEILQNRDLDFATMQRLRRFSRYWDLIANSGRFVETAPLIWKNGSPFREFLAFSDWLYTETRSTHGIALQRLARLLEKYLREKKGFSDISEVTTHAQARGPRARQSRHLADTSDDAG